MRSRGDVRWRCSLLAAHALALALVAWPGVTPAQDLEVAPSTSPDGVYQLSWTVPGEVTLEESRDPAFTTSRVVYRGPDNATTLTGRRNGQYFYRLEAPGLADTVVSVTVAHHPFARALGFFAVGLVVFVATVWLVVRGPDPEGRHG